MVNNNAKKNIFSVLLTFLHYMSNNYIILVQKKSCNITLKEFFMVKGYLLFLPMITAKDLFTLFKKKFLKLCKVPKKLMYLIQTIRKSEFFIFYFYFLIISFL
jgi:hypothetical protein